MQNNSVQIMSPNGTWSEKGPVLPVTPRLERWRRNRLLLILVILATFMFLLAIACGAVIYYHYVPQTKKSTAFERPCDIMLCSFGSRCLVDEGTGRAYCRCDETCSDVFAPVCGDDGATYSSECQLRLSSCTQQRRIAIQRQGACDVQDPCDTKVCGHGSFCKTSLDGRRGQCVCPEKCSNSGKGQSSRPVCGTDGKDYANECELKKASCKEMREIEVKFKGVCDPCDGVECPTSQICQLDDSRNPICRCNSVCSPDFRPMCGSDGKTYTNECTLRVESCKSRKNIRIIYTGECSSGSNPCDNLQCGPSQECDIDRRGTATCTCEDACEPVMRPVCGSDGRTYHSECELRSRACHDRKHVRVAYRGECGARGPCFKYQCSYGAQCVVKGGFTTCECPTCTEEYEPVCGTDGISYTNNCKLRREACEQKTEIAVAYIGLCNGCEKKRCEYYAVCESDGSGNGKCVCPQSCIAVESPVCGNDAVTYRNECEMRIEACRKAQYVMVVSKGPCDLCQNVHCKFGARCEEGRCVCPTDCPGAEEPVCANDGITYMNECKMRHAACIHDQELNMLFYGECDEVGETQDESGSGAEPDCEERRCRHGGLCEYDGDGAPQCVCHFACPVTFEPVCGSNGRRYDNECRLKEAACLQQKSVMAVHIEMCEEFREVPCDGELPLVDQLTGKDYFCGDGVGSKLCPPGSYCHKSTAFSKCCKEVILIKSCSETLYGCCEDGKVAAQGTNFAGCPSVCNCNRLGSYGLTCEPMSKQCFCKPGVGSPKCDRCEPGYWGLHRITEENSNGCTPCACNLYGSVRDDCEQMTGRCVCKHGIQGMKCDICPVGTILGPEGCMDESIAQPVSGSCDQLACFHGATCVEAAAAQGASHQAQCVCDIRCSPQDNQDMVCGSDGNTYGAECQMKQFSCRYQKTITVEAAGPCGGEDHQTVNTNSDLTLDESYLGISSNIWIPKYDNSRQQRHIDLDVLKKKSLKKGNITSENCARDAVQIQNLSENESLSLDLTFITYRKSGIILYSSSQQDGTIIFSLKLKNSYLELMFQKGNKSVILRPQAKISQGTHHKVSVRCFFQFVMIVLDTHSITKDSNADVSIFCLRPMNIYFGLPSKISEKSEVKTGNGLQFSGCICDFRAAKSVINAEFSQSYHYPKNQSSTVDLYRKHRLTETKNYGFPCGQKLPHKTRCHHRCSLVDSRSSRLTILFRVVKNTGLFVSWAPHPSPHQREFRLTIQGRRLQVMASEKRHVRVLVEHPEMLTEYEIHNATIRRYRRRLQLFLDDEMSETVMRENQFPHFQNSFQFKIGDYKVEENSTKNLLHTSLFKNTSHGCASKLTVNDSTLNMRDIAPMHLICKKS